jgi:ankyrin repeat protein
VGETALHTAGIKGDPDVVKALLDAGADANARTHGEAVQVDPINPC